MKLVMTLCVRDEEDIIKHNIEFHRAAGVDYFIVTDNLSQDGTKEILKSYERAGILDYSFSDDDTHSQFKHVTNMARKAYTEHGADWIINNDADEFWFPSGSANLKEVFAAMPEDVSSVHFERTNFVPVKSFATPFYSSMVYKQANPVNWLGESLPGKSAHRGDPEIQVKQGSHHIPPTGDSRSENSPGIEILHFPARDIASFEDSVVLSGQSYLNNDVLPKAVGKVRRQLYEEYLESGSLESFYKREYYGKARLASEFLKKNIVRDRRLQTFFDELYAG